MSRLPSLPSWPDPPADAPAAVGAFTRAARRRIEASGRSVEEVFGVVGDLVLRQGDDLLAERDAGADVWPVVDFDDLHTGAVSKLQIARVKQRGCVIVRGHFPRGQAREWDQEIVDYLDSNNFATTYRGAGDDFFAMGDATPTFLPIYWSPAQMRAHQHERMGMVQRFLNQMWSSPSGAEAMDPSQPMMYPDRLRRRRPGSTSDGLGHHIDAGTLDLWMKPNYQRAFRHVFDGSIEKFDPWDATGRTTGSQYPGTTMTSVFRTFQGWTALSDMAHDQGVLQVVPIPSAIAYLLLRPLLTDVAEDDMCGAAISRSFLVSQEWHGDLLRASIGLPDIEAGDSVWWHCDLVHGVAPVVDQQGWGNVMYIPAAPACPRNVEYSVGLVDALRTGSSPSDLPAEHYERTWPNRFREQDLNAHGRRSLGLL